MTVQARANVGICAFSWTVACGAGPVKTSNWPYPAGALLTLLHNRSNVWLGCQGVDRTLILKQ